MGSRGPRCGLPLELLLWENGEWVNGENHRGNEGILTLGDGENNRGNEGWLILGKRGESWATGAD
jgi:hypothetical protein